MRAIRRSGTGRNPRGFTLLELVVTILIMGILTSVAAVTYNKYISSANDARAQQQVSQLAKITLAESAQANLGLLTRPQTQDGLAHLYQTGGNVYLATADSLDLCQGTGAPHTAVGGDVANGWALCGMTDLPQNTAQFSVVFDNGTTDTADDNDTSGTRAIFVTRSSSGSYWAAEIRFGVTLTDKCKVTVPDAEALAIDPSQLQACIDAG